MHNHHRDPGVLTHFFPGVFIGAVIGLIFGAFFIADIAQNSLRTYWEVARTTKHETLLCATSSDIKIDITQTFFDIPSAFSLSLGETWLGEMKGDPASYHVLEASSKYAYIGKAQSPEGIFPLQTLYAVDLCQKTLETVLDGTEGEVRVIAISPNAQHAFLVHQDETENREVLGVYELETGKMFHLETETEEPAMFIGEAQFSADGSQIAYIRFNEAIAQIYVWSSFPETRTAELFDTFPQQINQEPSSHRLLPWGLGHDPRYR